MTFYNGCLNQMEISQHCQLFAILCPARMTSAHICLEPSASRGTVGSCSSQCRTHQIQSACTSSPPLLEAWVKPTNCY
ncbi:hypothetical protein GN956_G17961 [Arapaima gigas]